MITYYNGYNIEWLESTFKIGKKNFSSLRGAMDYVDGKNARVNNNTGNNVSDSHSEPVVHKLHDK